MGPRNRTAEDGGGDPDAGPPDAERVTERVAADLEADRVGVWTLEEGGGLLRRVHLYDRASGRHHGGGLLSAERFPRYFRALREEGELAVEDVESDPRVAELLSPYARPLGIASWLDVPIRDEEGDASGLLRLERRGSPRVWGEGERLRAREAARELIGRDVRREPGRDPAGGRDGPPSRAGDEPRTVAVESNPAGIGILDLDGRVLHCNPALARDLAYDSPQEMRGRNLVRNRFASERSWRGLLGRLHREGRITDHEVEVVLPGSDASRWLLHAATLLGPEEGRKRVLATVVDVTDRRGRESRLRRQAFRDPLTGLANRRLLREAAEQTLALADRHDRPAGLLYLDLARFKEVNDRYGHDVGDLVLVAVADRLRERVRESDLAARIGGDEFAVLLPEVGGEEGAMRAGRRLLEDLDRPVSVGEDHVRVSGKAGIALCPRDGRELDDLLRRADQAMYRTRDLEDRDVVLHGERPGAEADAQESGPREGGGEHGDGPRGDSGEHEKGNPGGSEEDEPGTAGGTAFGPEELRRALSAGELSLHYQPVVRSEDRTPTGAEALLRWNHPERGLQVAGAFLSDARDAGLLPEIDRWALERAVRRASRWSRAKLRWVAVNVSAETLAGRAVAMFLDGLVVEYGLLRKRLLVEATLSPDAGGLDDAIRTLRNIRAKGFPVALDYTGPADDLGEAFGGARVDVLKVDRGLVDSLPPEVVAERWDAAVLVKRVETEADFREVSERRVPFAQGYFLGRPVPAEELETSG